MRTPLSAVLPILALTGCTPKLSREEAAVKFAPVNAKKWMTLTYLYNLDKKPPMLELMDVANKDDPKWPEERKKLIADYHQQPNDKGLAELTEVSRKKTLEEGYAMSDEQWFGEDNQKNVRCAIKVTTETKLPDSRKDFDRYDADTKSAMEDCVGHVIVADSKASK